MTGVGRIESVRGVAHPEYGGEGCLGDNSWSTGCTGGLVTWTRACKLFNVIAYLTHIMACHTLALIRGVGAQFSLAQPACMPNME